MRHGLKLVLVAVMGVRNVRVVVDLRRVYMPVVMRRPGWVAGAMLMMVVVVMFVQVLVVQALMHVSMAVTLAHENPNT